VLAIEMGCTARDLTETIHPHPTLSETVGAGAEVFFGTATEIYRPKREAQGT
jgi:dihydrolipoamide dehydrogenase